LLTIVDGMRRALGDLDAELLLLLFAARGGETRLAPGLIALGLLLGGVLLVLVSLLGFR
jgi:cadmium resistance protein CadD (predicted permease)